MNKVREYLEQLKQKVVEFLNKLKVLLGLKEVKQEERKTLGETYTYTIDAINQTTDDCSASRPGCIANVGGGEGKASTVIYLDPYKVLTNPQKSKNSSKSKKSNKKSNKKASKKKSKKK